MLARRDSEFSFYITTISKMIFFCVRAISQYDSGVLLFVGRINNIYKLF